MSSLHVCPFVLTIILSRMLRDRRSVMSDLWRSMMVSARKSLPLRTSLDLMRATMSFLILCISEPTWSDVSSKMYTRFARSSTLSIHLAVSFLIEISIRHSIGLMPSGHSSLYMPFGFSPETSWSSMLLWGSDGLLGPTEYLRFLFTCRIGGADSFGSVSSVGFSSIVDRTVEKSISSFFSVFIVLVSRSQIYLANNTVKVTGRGGHRCGTQQIKAHGARSQWSVTKHLGSSKNVKNSKFTILWEQIRFFCRPTWSQCAIKQASPQITPRNWPLIL